MIFIGAELANPHAHFRTNIVSAIGGGNDLVIDLWEIRDKKKIYDLIRRHLEQHDEQFVIYNAYEDEDFFLEFKARFPNLRLITFFSDDEWRHENYDRYLALYSDIFTVAVKENIERYHSYGLDHVHYMRWACNPEVFHPVPATKQDIDVSFIGAAYGKRVEYVRHLLRNGVDVRVFGPGWERFRGIRKHWGGFLSHEDMLKTIARSKVNLNFLWTSWNPSRTTIKGRTLELSACRAFQLSNDTHEFANYGFEDGVNIAVFRGKDGLVEKVLYYLEHEEAREAIAARAYEHVIRNHTWKQRFDDLFHRLEAENGRSECTQRRRYRILVLVDDGVRHRIHREDDRMEIQIARLDEGWRDALPHVDGVVHLQHDSDMNNETLYMMAFGLAADKSDVVAANFYVGRKEDEGSWIRFRDRQLERRRALLTLLPLECMMFSGRYAAEYGSELAGDLKQLKVSYIEYPSFGIELSYLQSRLLRLYFGHYRDARNRFKRHLRNMRFGKAVTLGVDKVWQGMQKK